jgi:hypothetical protein
MAVLNANYAHFLSNTTIDKKTIILRDLMDVQITTRNIFVVEEFYIIKFADLIGAIPYCSINKAVAGYFSRATSAGVFPSSPSAFGSAPESTRALMMSSGAPLSAAKCNVFHLYCYSFVC